MLDCLSHLCDTLSELSEEEIWRGLRTAFACVCADTTRLRLTAEVFAHHLQQLPTPLAQVEILIQAVEWVISCDIVDWLVPAPVTEQAVHTTFKDSEALLGVMEVAHICLPQPPDHPLDYVWILIGPAPWCQTQTSARPSSVCYTIEECLQALSNGNCPAFFDGPYDSVGFIICLDDWTGFWPQPDLTMPTKAFRAILDRELLCGDLARLALRLWGLGVPTSLLYPTTTSHALAPLPEVQLLEHGTQEGRSFLRNCRAIW